MTIKQIIAEVESIFPQYAEEGLVDRISIARNIKSALKAFGNNIMIKNEGFISIKGGKGKLPNDYWNLLVAVKVEPYGYEITKGDKQTLLDSYFFRERTEERNVWNLTLDEYVPKDTVTIREKFVFNKAEADFKYIPKALLKLVKAFKRNECAKDSPYQSKDFAVNSPYEINILGDYIQTNFAKGNIYMQYLALPSNDDGDIIIPDTQHDELRKYILYLAQEEVLYRVLMSDDDPHVANKYSLVRELKEDARQLAYTETKMGALRGWKEAYIKKKRLQTLAYDRLQPRR